MKKISKLVSKNGEGSRSWLWLHVLLPHLQSLHQRRPPSSYIQVVRDAQRLPDVGLVIVESLLQDLPLRWPVSRLPPAVTDHDADPGWRRQEMSGPWRKRGLQHHRRLASKLPQVNHSEGPEWQQTWRVDTIWERTIALLWQALPHDVLFKKHFFFTLQAKWF